MRNLAYALAVALTLACTNPGAPEDLKVMDRQTGAVLTLSQAERELGFRVILPKYLPRGTPKLALIEILDREERPFSPYIQSVYHDESKISLVTIRLTQESLGIPVERVGYERITVHDVEVDFEADPYGKGLAELHFLWRGKESHFFLEVLWHGRSYSSELRREGERIIGSILDQER
jgi:hypothetical protein